MGQPLDPRNIQHEGSRIGFLLATCKVFADGGDAVTSALIRREWQDTVPGLPTLLDEAIGRQSIYTREDNW